MDSEKIKTLAVYLLQTAADVFSNHGCNDIDEEAFEGWTDEDKQLFLEKANEYHGSGSFEHFNQLGDNACMEVVAFILKKS